MTNFPIDIYGHWASASVGSVVLYDGASVQRGPAPLGMPTCRSSWNQFNHNMWPQGKPMSILPGWLCVHRFPWFSCFLVCLCCLLCSFQDGKLKRCLGVRDSSFNLLGRNLQGSIVRLFETFDLVKSKNARATKTRTKKNNAPVPCKPISASSCRSGVTVSDLLFACLPFETAPIPKAMNPFGRPGKP